jgi:rod shape-determining protein MreB
MNIFYLHFQYRFKGRCTLFGLGQDIGIDLGTASIIVYIKGKGIVLGEPSVVAIDKNTNQLLAVGEEARRMLGRTPGNIVAIRPLREGVISDYDITERMLKHFINKVCGNKLFKFFQPRIIVCVPSGVTEVEKRAVREAAMQAGARKTYLIEEPLAAAIGAGVDISKACGSMVIDVGGGTTDIAVISLGGIVVSSSIKIAGDKFDEAIIRYMRKKHNIMIGERTAEELKINIGAVYPRVQEASMEVRGRNLISGLPKTLTVTSSEIMEALEEPVSSIVEAVHSVLERTPPELASDISDRGIIMTGGGSLVYGFDKLIQEKTGINVIIADDAISCVALGTGKALEHIEIIEKSDSIDKRSNYR